jgi:PAS domain S-box-containing protein
MTATGSQFGCLSDPRLTTHALSPTPTWLWSADAARILWANPTAAAIFDAASPGALAAIEFDAKHPAAAQIARLAPTLPRVGTPRLERLRGFGASLGGMMICLCSRFTLSDNTTAVLVVASERAGPNLSLPERARRLLADADRPTAIFSADGELIDCTPAGRERIGAAHDLIALGAEKLAKEASINGEAKGKTAAGHIAVQRLGAGATVALLVTFDVPAARPAAVAVEAPPFVVEPGIEQPLPPPVEPPIEQPLPPPAAAIPPTPAATIPPTPTPRPSASNGSTRRFPLRFVWQIDAANCFTIDSEDFIRLIGTTAAGLLNRPWADIAGALTLDPQGEVAHALDARETFSGIVVPWPAGDTGERLPVEMSGLPIFDDQRRFEGFRGFGVCRDVDRIAAIALAPKAAPSTTVEPVDKPVAEQDEPAAEPVPEPPVAPVNVLPFRSTPAPAEPAPNEPAPTLSPGEQNAFAELARELTDRLKKTRDALPQRPLSIPPEPVADVPPRAPPKPQRNDNKARDSQESRPILDRLPSGVLIYRLDKLVYANHAFLDWTGYQSLDELSDAGGLDALFIETAATPADGGKNGGTALTIATPHGDRPVEGRLLSIIWNGDPALALVVNTAPPIEIRIEGGPESQHLEVENRELKAILDTATDGVLVLDRAGRVLSANRSAEALFGYNADELEVLAFSDLFAPESRQPAYEYLDRLARERTPVLINEGQEVIGMVREGGLVPLYMTMGRIEGSEKLCAVFRDITAWKRTEEELINARQQAEKSSSAKSEFLARISHEIRTPLNSIIGFSEVMMNERFGPIGNDRYRQYLRDIHASGGHLISLVNDLLDLSKIEAGKLELTFVSVDLNDLVQQCVAIMQQQANEERVIIRTSLGASLPPIVADARSVRQIALNLLSNSIKFTGAGGQVIVSTAITGSDVILRVRDTGSGMSEKDLETALEPFRQVATSSRAGGSGLGLPISKALAEANHARFRITSQVSSGTLVEIIFPATKAAAAS